MIINARMYAVTPHVETIWKTLLEHITLDAGLACTYLPYLAPQPLETLWRRDDLASVFMCGYPIALGIADVVPIAAPILALDWADGQPVYRSDLIVRKDAPCTRLEDTFGGRAGWTVEHSHSGFNAFRHHLLRYRTPERPNLYASMAGNLITARRVLDSVLDGSIDIGPLDAYWHALIAKYAPEITTGIRVLASTDVAPMPAFVASAGISAEKTEHLREAFAMAHTRAWFAPLAEKLLLKRFSAVKYADFAKTLAWDREAKAAGYPFPG